MKFSYSKILEHEGSKKRFLTLFSNKTKRSLMKSKDLYRHKGTVEHSNIE